MVNQSGGGSRGGVEREVDQGGERLLWGCVSRGVLCLGGLG